MPRVRDFQVDPYVADSLAPALGGAKPAHAARAKLSIGVLAALVACSLGACATADNADTDDIEALAPAPSQALPAVDAGSSDDTADTGPPPEVVRRDGGAQYTYGDWSGYAACSVTCGDGVKTRT